MLSLPHGLRASTKAARGKTSSRLQQAARHHRIAHYEYRPLPPTTHRTILAYRVVGRWWDSRRSDRWGSPDHKRSTWPPGTGLRQRDRRRSGETEVELIIQKLMALGARPPVAVSHQLTPTAVFILLRRCRPIPHHHPSRIYLL
jgi:hypothetical protein